VEFVMPGSSTWAPRLSAAHQVLSLLMLQGFGALPRVPPHIPG
jgi:hypothetical protein